MLSTDVHQRFFCIAANTALPAGYRAKHVYQGKAFLLPTKSSVYLHLRIDGRKSCNILQRPEMENGGFGKHKTCMGQSMTSMQSHKDHTPLYRERSDFLTRSHIPGPSKIARPPRASAVGLSGLPRLSRAQEPSRIPSRKGAANANGKKPSLIESLVICC